MTRKPDEWMPLHIGVYHADTVHLSRDQHGAYLLLLMAYWRRGGPLLADDARLAAIAKATSAEWRKLRPVMLEFFTEADGSWHQKRADAELEKARRLTEAKAAAGAKGAAKKWHGHSKPDGKPHGTAMAELSRSQWQNDAPSPSPLPSQEAVATASQEDSNQINRLNRLLRFDERNFSAHAANIRVLVDLKAEGCDFDAHIWPAAEAAARAGRAKSLNYIAPRARELRDAAKVVASMPTPFENTDQRGWKDRMGVFRNQGMWSPKWGPRPDEQGCRCPVEILTAKEDAA